MADNDAGSERPRVEVGCAEAAGKWPRRDGVIAGLRRSPLVGAGVKLDRAEGDSRPVEL